MKRSLATILILVSISLFFSWSISSCRRNPPLKDLRLTAVDIPTGFPKPYYNFDAENPLTEEGIELGRRLFYDPILAGDDEHSCASCHEQRASFGTFQHDRSHGFNESHTLRNAPVLINLAWSPYLHWDGALNSIESVSLQPIQGDHEMGGNFITIINRLEKDDYYNHAFKKVFRTPFIRREFITRALAQFIGTLVSYNSKYDKYKNGTASFTAEEANGYALFKAKCNTCHAEPLFTDYSFRNIGLAADPELNDFGRMRITGLKSDSLKFKVPTLRNVQTSSNYMHDGRFITLYQCINHYRTGINQSATLDPSLQNGINLTNADAQDLVSFLKTLTDSSFLVNPKFKDPNN